MLNSQHTRLQLGHNGNVIGRYLVFTHGTGHNDTGNVSAVVECLLGEVEVELHEAGARGGGGELPTGGVGGDTGEVGDHGGCS